MADTSFAGYTLAGTVRVGRDWVLYRATRDEDRTPVLVKAPRSDHPSRALLRQLEHEVEVAADLDPRWVVRPLALERYPDHLVLADSGGGALADVLDGPMEVGRFLRLAVQLAAALAEIHRHRIIHKDIKPSNVLFDPSTGEARVTDFGIASLLPREHQAAASPALLEGTLAYMSPEQTGRMNRAVDHRSDLYSLGITFYEMLTGALPCQACDPLEWVHFHIARTPRPPIEIVPELPLPVSDIVVRLLAKMAEERYQTALGLQRDLERCLREWESEGKVEPFPLGERDVSDRLEIPQRLYGRERDLAALLAAYDRVAATGTPELVLVSGYSGIGKSSLVSELHKPIVRDRGFFLSGKFDQYEREIPYATFAQAFRALVQQILGESEEQIAVRRRRLQETLGDGGQVLVDVIPELELIIGKQPPAPELPPAEAQNRFHVAFRRLVAAFARREHPLALFLDDLQWADSGSLGLLQDLLTDSGMRHVFIVGAYRDNEVSPAHPLLLTLDEVLRSGARVATIVLGPIGRADLAAFVGDALHCRPGDAAPLADLVHEKTAGNPFFAIQFLTALHEEGLIEFDRQTEAFRWENSRIRAKAFTDNVADLMVGKLKRLPAATQSALEQLACLGNRAEVSVLTRVHGGSEQDTLADLWDAARAGLIFRADGAYRFLHDRVQEAAYSLIPEAERAAVHLGIGRELLASTPPEQLEEAIFEIVNQWNRGASLLLTREDRERVAELNLLAGKRAKGSTAYASALQYLAAGSALLGDEDRWERRYDLAFALELSRAECEYLTGALEAAETRLADLGRRAASIADVAAVRCVRVALYTTLDRSDRAVEACLEYLRRLGVDWSPHPTDEDVESAFKQLWQQLGSRSIEELAALPSMTDRDCLATMAVLTDTISPAMFTDQNLLCLVTARAAILSLEHGNSDASCFAYVMLGMLLGSRFGDYRSAFRFGKLGLDLVDLRGLDRFKARVYMNFGHAVQPWTRHVRESLGLLRSAFDKAQSTGDLTFAAYSCNTLITILLAAGEPLGDVLRETENRLDFVRKARFGLVVDTLIGQVRLIRTLLGLLPDFASFNDDEFDEDRFERHLEDSPPLVMAACWYWIRKLQARYFAGDHEAALAAASRAEPLLWTSPSFFVVAEYHFYGALARAARCDDAPEDERARHLAALAERHRQLDIWAENCPDNFHNRRALVSAEIARLEGRAEDAMRLYEEAIRSAREGGFVQNEAIAFETAARFYRARGMDLVADTYLRAARDRYLRWGADGKVRQLERLFPQLVEPAPPAVTTTVGIQSDRLDLLTVIKASQAISGQIVLDDLIETLMRVVLENAGAQTATLLLSRGGALTVARTASVDGDRGVSVRREDEAPSPADLPISLLNYVHRSRAQVLLPDAAQPNLFAADEYLVRKGPASVLCLPILRRAEPIGLLYLENNLVRDAFTPDRVAMANLLAAQAAISLENARLYAELRHENRERTRAGEELRASLHEKEVLLKEVHHRVKNNLQLISSLLALQAGQLEDHRIDAAFTEIQNRVRAMALVHESLYRTRDLASVRLADHLEALCAHLYRSYNVDPERIALRLQIEDASLDLDRSMRCALIVNELVSNALKHAFPAGREGRITVRFDVLPDARVLVVSDDGVGLSPGIDLDRSDTLGLQLVGDLADQLGATLAIERETGTTFTLQFPVIADLAQV